MRGNHGERHHLTNLSLFSNTNEIFSEMEARTGMPCSVMHLLLGQKVVEQNLTVQKAGITNECLIHLSVRGNGGGKGSHNPCVPCITIIQLPVVYNYKSVHAAEQQVLVTLVRVETFVMNA